MEGWPSTSSGSPAAWRPRSASEEPQAAQPQPPQPPPSAVTEAQLTAATLLQAQLPGSLTPSDRTQSQAKVDSMRASALSSTERLSPLEVAVQNARRGSSLPPLVHGSSRQPSPRSTDALSSQQDSNSLRSTSPLGPGVMALERLAREADVFANPALRPPAIRPPQAAAGMGADNAGPCTPPQGQGHTRSTHTNGPAIVDPAMATAAVTAIATPTAAPAGATAAPPALDSAAPTAYSGMLRSLDTSCGKLFPDFAPDRQLYILLVPIDTREVCFYPTAYRGEVLINHDAPCQPITLHPAVASQKVIIDVKLHDPSAATTDGHDGRGSAGGARGCAEAGNGEGERSAGDATGDRGRRPSSSVTTAPSSHHPNDAAGTPQGTGSVSASRGDLAGHGITTYVVDIRRSPLADDYANETSTFIGSKRPSAADIAVPAALTQTNDSGSNAMAVTVPSTADTADTAAAAAAAATAGGYANLHRQANPASTQAQHHPPVLEDQVQQRGVGAGSIPIGDRARRIVGRDFHSSERGHLSVAAGTIVHTLERRGQWYLAEIVDEQTVAATEPHCREQRGGRGASRQPQRQQQRRRRGWLSRLFRSNRVSTNATTASANKQQEQQQRREPRQQGRAKSPPSPSLRVWDSRGGTTGPGATELSLSQPQQPPVAPLSHARAIAAPALPGTREGQAIPGQPASGAHSAVGWIPVWCLVAQFEVAQPGHRGSHSSSGSDVSPATDSAFVSGGDRPLPSKLSVSFASDPTGGGANHAVTSTPRVRILESEAPTPSRHNTGSHRHSSHNSSHHHHHHHHHFRFGSDKAHAVRSDNAVRPFSSPETKRRAKAERIGSGRSVLSQAPSLLASSMLSSTGVLETIPEDSPKTRPWVTMTYLVVQIVMLVVCLGYEGGIAPLPENPLAGASVKVLRDTGAIWPPDVIDGRLYLLLTSLCVPVGILRLVADAAILLLIGVPVERTHGSRVVLIALLVGGVGGNLFACCVLTRHYMTGGGGAVMGLVGTVIAGMFVFQHPRRAVAYDLGLAAALTLVASLLGPLPLHNNWQQAGGVIFGIVVSLFTLSFASPARPPRGVERTMLTAQKLPEGPFLLWRLTRDKRYDLAYAGLFTTALLILVAIIVLFAFVPPDAPSCDWCTRASCFPFHNWCFRDQATAQNTTDGA